MFTHIVSFPFPLLHLHLGHLADAFIQSDLQLVPLSELLLLLLCILYLDECRMQRQTIVLLGF